MEVCVCFSQVNWHDGAPSLRQFITPSLSTLLLHHCLSVSLSYRQVQAAKWKCQDHTCQIYVFIVRTHCVCWEQYINIWHRGGVTLLELFTILVGFKSLFIQIRSAECALWKDCWVCRTWLPFPFINTHTHSHTNIHLDESSNVSKWTAQAEVCHSLGEMERLDQLSSPEHLNILLC